MININKIVEQCYNKLPYHWKNHPWDATDHGRKVLQNDWELDAYLAAYGEMHIVKCSAALQNFPCDKDDDIQKHNYEIFDWGCGQGIATLTLLDFLRERGLLGRLNSITLIEPSEIALNRAKKWVTQNVGPAVKVKAVKEYIPSNENATLDEVSCSSYISINLFSNILDIRDLSLLWLARKTSSLAIINYMICVGPKFSENTRIKDFCGYFNPNFYFSSIDAYHYGYTSKTHHSYSCETKCFVHLRNNDLNNTYIEQATIIEPTDDYDYSIECLRGVVEDKTLDFYNKIRNECCSAFSVFLRPTIGVDTPDIILASKSRGIVIVNICNNLSSLEDDFKRVENIKSYLFNTHLKSIRIDSIINRSVYGTVKTALFFTNSSQEEVEESIQTINQNITNRDPFAYLIRLFENDDFGIKLNNINAYGFRSDYYNELLHIITGNWHSYKDGDTNFRLTDKQKDIVRSDNNRLRVKGIAGCGKTQVVANRAVERHLKTGRKVLILTFNISLIQYVRMRINQVPADFSTTMFEITNYHQFFLSMANRYSYNKISLHDFDDPSFFNPYRDIIEKYNTILIDEVQDFKTNWLNSIISNFLAPNGTISVFGDGEQNIYDRKMEEETKMPVIPTFTGRWNEINERISLRIINPEIAKISFLFAKQFIDNNIQPLNISNELIFENYSIKYWNVGSNKTAYDLYKNINWIRQRYDLKPRNITVLSESINILRDIEKYYNDKNQYCMTNFETAEEYAKLKQLQVSPSLFKKNLDEIRKAAKTHFTTDVDDIKLSTIHSFKGWESDSVVLLLQPEMQTDSYYEGYYIRERENTPALLYTALTRARFNLFILNMGNDKYHSFFNNNHCCPVKVGESFFEITELKSFTNSFFGARI